MHIPNERHHGTPVAPVPVWMQVAFFEAVSGDAFLLSLDFWTQGGPAEKMSTEFNRTPLRVRTSTTQF